MELTNFFNMNPVVFYFFVIAASLFIVAKSADLLVYGISDYAKKLGISDYLVGFIIVSIGTALPELIASMTGALVKQGGIVFGTILGSNIFKIPLLGVVILIGRKIKINANDVGNAPIITLFLTILPLFLIIDGILSRGDGIILLIAFLIYIARLWHGEGQLGKMKKDVELKNIYKDAIIFVGALAALLLSARWLVFSSIGVSEVLNVSPYVIGLVVIGIGASTPELMVQLRSVLKRKHDLAFGNVLGSIVANSSLVLGLTSLISPFSMSIKTLFLTSIFMLGGILYVLILMGKEEVNWKHGLLLISIYILFLIFEGIF